MWTEQIADGIVIGLVQLWRQLGAIVDMVTKARRNRATMHLIVLPQAPACPEPAKPYLRSRAGYDGSRGKFMNRRSVTATTWLTLSALGLYALCDPAPLEGATVPDAPVEVPVCRVIETAAKARALPVEFLTRLIWQESSFRPRAVSSAGAQGIAQFMPGTADERGLADPFDPEEAIPKAAELLAELKVRFGNLGLAAAAYNAGPNRVATWLVGRGGLPDETRSYVLKITRRTVQDWQSDHVAAPRPAPSGPNPSCLQLAALIKKGEPGQFAGSALTAFWGVQLAGSFSKDAALASFERAKKSYASVLGNVQPIVIGGRLLNRGFSPFYRVRVPAASRTAANALCQKITRLGGACATLRG